MLKNLLTLDKQKLLPEVLEKLGEYLNLDGPLPISAFLKAMQDQDYAAQLLDKQTPSQKIESLIAEATSENPRANRDDKEEKNITSAGNLELIQSVIQALIRWGKAGFFKVDTITLEKREDACLACPHLIAPDRLMQKIIPSRPVSQEVGDRTGNKVCQLCGCNVSKKIRIPTEVCPSEHLEQQGMTRWGEAVSKKSFV